MKRNLSITIGITAFNEGNLLNEAWYSVLNQTIDNWEAIIVLDGGGDKKTKKIFQLIENPKLKKFHFDNNQGTYLCRTKAIEMTETDWYFQLDGDDLLPTNAVELVLNKINVSPDANFISGACKHFALGPDQIKLPENNPERLCISPLFFAQAPIRKKLFNRMGGFFIPKQFIHSDWDFWLSVYEGSIVGAEIDDVIYMFRRRINSISNQNFHVLPLALERIIERHPKYFFSEERKQRARFDVFEKTARIYRSKGKRKLAKKYADLAIQYGQATPVLHSINKEYDMSILRYYIRRLGRII